MMALFFRFIFPRQSKEIKSNCLLGNEKGFSFVEVFVATAILVVLGYSISTGFLQFRKVSKQTNLVSTNEKQIYDIVDNIRNSIESYQITFDPTPSLREKVLNINALPMAWDLHFYGKAKDCASCKGRYGFIIQPYEKFNGLYLITLRMTYQGWSEGFRDYQFITSIK